MAKSSAVHKSARWPSTWNRSESQHPRYLCPHLLPTYHCELFAMSAGTLSSYCPPCTDLDINGYQFNKTWKKWVDFFSPLKKNDIWTFLFFRQRIWSWKVNLFTASLLDCCCTDVSAALDSFIMTFYCLWWAENCSQVDTCTIIYSLRWVFW